MTSQFSNMTSSLNFLDVVLFLLSSLVTGPSFMVQVSCKYHHWFWNCDNFFYKRLTSNPEIGNTPVCGLPNIWKLGQIRNTKFGSNVSNKMLLNAAKWQRYSFYRFWVIKGKPTAEGKITPLPPPPPSLDPTQIRVKIHENYLWRS